MTDVGKLSRHTEGLAWSLEVIPRHQANLDPLISLRVRGAAGSGPSYRKIDERRDIEVEALGGEFGNLCQAMGIRRRTAQREKGEVRVVVKDVDLSEVSLEAIADAQRRKLITIEGQILSLMDEKEKLQRVVDAIAGPAPAIAMPSNMRQEARQKPRQPPATSKEDNRPLTDRIVALMGSRDGSWVAGELAVLLRADRGIVAVTLGKMATQGRIRRIERGLYELAEVAGPE